MANSVLLGNRMVPRSCAAQRTTLSRSIIPLLSQAEFWISHPFLGLRSMAKYIGNPTEIQCPPAHTTAHGFVHAYQLTASDVRSSVGVD